MNSPCSERPLVGISMSFKIQETIYFVEDLDEAVEHYTTELGFVLDKKFGWGFALLKVGDEPRLGLMARNCWEQEVDTDGLPAPRVSLQADRIEAERQRLVDAGVKVSALGGSSDGMKAFTFWDRFGNAFFVWSEAAVG